MARGSLLLDLRKRKIPLAPRGGAKGDTRDTRAKGFGVSSDWPDLNDLCNDNNIQLNWIHTTGEQVSVSEELIMDLNVHAEATLHHDNSSKKLYSRTYRYEILKHLHSQQRDYWVNLRLQGKLACLQCADPAV